MHFASLLIALAAASTTFAAPAVHAPKDASVSSIASRLHADAHLSQVAPHAHKQVNPAEHYTPHPEDVLINEDEVEEFDEVRLPLLGNGSPH